MAVKEFLEGLDEAQRKAVSLNTNAVVSAGAGSGKTRVLASRYIWLVTEKELKPEEILTLTFTNKAVSEMYSRIYQYLLEQSGQAATDKKSERAASAIANFHKARISTLDSFSAHIARTASSRYGISGDFSSDETALRDIAREAALRFVLDNREAPAIRQLLVNTKIKVIAEEIFAKVVLRHSALSSPLELDQHLLVQKNKLLAVWKENTRRMQELIEGITGELKELASINQSIKFTKALETIVLAAPPPTAPDITPLLEIANNDADWSTDSLYIKTLEDVKKYFDYYSALTAISIPTTNKECYAPLVEYFIAIKGRKKSGLYYLLTSIANNICSFAICSGLFTLLHIFEAEFNAKKREMGLLSFTDIARLAVDALKSHPDIRNVYKDSIRMIMIDEFQDNNALQRDLIYLLAEHQTRSETGLPAPCQLESNRMFFVGDEKQSIYRFRGADVAVFRSLGQDLSDGEENNNLELAHNYRSHPKLIAAFNYIFERVFLPATADTPPYEAVYSGILPPKTTNATTNATTDADKEDSEPHAHVCFLNAEELPENDTENIKAPDLEAVFIAKTIQNMVMQGKEIPKRDGKVTKWEKCTWNDFAVLQRSCTHQSSLEKYFREFGIPYAADRPSGLFNEAPILDMRAYLRLLVYPEDRIAYASLIRSPFMRLSDLTLTVCMMNKKSAPFAEENEPLIPTEDLQLYRRARKKYLALCEASRSLATAELVTKLWFEEGYRYETLWEESTQVYEGLFDLFFNLATESDERGKSLAEFIEYLDDVMSREEKPDNKDIPGEEGSGVRITTIHKSKGLEFPVVFMYNCTNSGNSETKADMVKLHDKYGLILNIPQAGDLMEKGNYFLEILIEEENAKGIAELRRILYVAMTRAEYQVYLTFTLPAQTQIEKKQCDLSGQRLTPDVIRKRLIQLTDKMQEPNTFLKLLTEPLSTCPESLCSLEAIPVLSRSEIRTAAAHYGNKIRMGKKQNAMTQKEAFIAADPSYEAATILARGKAFPSHLDASKLHYQSRSQTSEAPIYDNSPFDTLLKKAALNAAEAGTLVHTVLEARLNKQPFFAPSTIRSRIDSEALLRDLVTHAEGMAEAFFSSELGRRWEVSEFQYPEFAVLTSANAREKVIAIIGKMDLLFCEGGEVVVVDFKTDKAENPADHFGQLAAYYRAASDIFAKPVSTWLFYLRSGKAVNVTDEVKTLSLEELAEAALILEHSALIDQTKPNGSLTLQHVVPSGRTKIGCSSVPGATTLAPEARACSEAAFTSSTNS